MPLEQTRKIDQHAAGELLAVGGHYLAAIARMGDSCTVVAGEDIVGTHGIKLLAKGARIDSSVLDKLADHRLSRPLEQQLTLAEGESPAMLAKAAAAILDGEPWWGEMARRSGDANAIRHGLAALRIPAAVGFKLTVAREQRPALYQHSLRVALLAYYFALRLGLGTTDTERLLLAALCHDLGELHTNPAILVRGHRVNDEERRHIFVHPITSYLILRQISGSDAEVARAVLHHQERLDGSGYPAGLQAAAISPLAKILAVADVAETVLARFVDHRRMSTLLRLNLLKYDSRIVALLHELLRAPGSAAPVGALPADELLGRRFARISMLLTDWDALRARIEPIPAAGGRNGLGFLFERVRGFSSTLLQFGFDPDSFEMLSELAREDAEIAAELTTVLDETRFQLAEMASEIDRREAEGEFDVPAELRPAFDGWRRMLKHELTEN